MIKILYNQCIILLFTLIMVNNAFANGPALTGPMKKFDTTPLSERELALDREITWRDKYNHILSLDNFKGKVVLINFWATWCPPCVQELPSIDRLQKKIGGDNFVAIAISLDRGGKKIAERMFKRLKLKNLSLYLDPTNASAQKLNIRVMPTTIVFDRTGRRLGKLEGKIEWDEPEPVRLLKYYINSTYRQNTKSVNTAN